MNPKRGFHRIFVVLAILWLIPVVVLTVVLMPPKQEAPIIYEWELDPIATGPYRLDDVEAVTQLEKRGMITPEEEKEALGTFKAIRMLQDLGKLPSDQNLIYKPPSFWKSEEGTKLIKQVNDKILLKSNIFHSAFFVFKGFLFWSIPLAFVYLMGIIIWWITVGFSSNKL